jgi:hypothetical protein
MMQKLLTAKIEYDRLAEKTLTLGNMGPTASNTMVRHRRKNTSQ